MILHLPSKLIADGLEAAITLEQNLPPEAPARLALRTLARSMVELLVETLIDDILPKLDPPETDGPGEAQPDSSTGVLP